MPRAFSQSTISGITILSTDLSWRCEQYDASSSGLLRPAIYHSQPTGPPKSGSGQTTLVGKRSATPPSSAVRQADDHFNIVPGAEIPGAVRIVAQPAGGCRTNVARGSSRPL